MFPSTVALNSDRFATPGSHPGPQGSGASNFQNVWLPSFQKTKSEHEHSSGDEQERSMELMRTEGQTIIKHQEKCSPKGPGGAQIRAWRAPGSFRAPCGLKVAARGASNRSAARGPRKRKQIHGTPPGRSWAALGFIFQPPQGSRRLPERLPESQSCLFFPGQGVGLWFFYAYRRSNTRTCHSMGSADLASVSFENFRCTDGVGRFPRPQFRTPGVGHLVCVGQTI